MDKDGELIIQDCYRYRAPKFWESQVLNEYQCTNEQQSLVTDKDSLENRVVVEMDPVSTALFTIECVLEVIGMGFFMDADSYLRDPGIG